jgi:hypothetical protein
MVSRVQERGMKPQDQAPTGVFSLNNKKLARDKHSSLASVTQKECFRKLTSKSPTAFAPCPEKKYLTEETRGQQKPNQFCNQGPMF